MKTALKVVAGLLGLVLLLAGGGLAYLSLAFPKVGPAPDLKVDATPERLARGAYLARNVCSCVDCHSTRDWTKFSGPVVPGTEGKGGERFDRAMGFPGEFYASNITPAGVGGWTDGELARALTGGVTHDGRALFPLMPYPLYGEALCQEDVSALVAFVRTLKPLENLLPAAQLDFPMNFIVKTIPADRPRPPCPDKKNEVSYGKYLATVGGCIECHTRSDKGQRQPGMDCAGGREFHLPGLGTVRSANLTPSDSGIGLWEKDFFVDKFRDYRKATLTKLNPGSVQTIMPWTLYAGMTDDDLGALYAYLKTVTPVQNEVKAWTAGP